MVPHATKTSVIKKPAKGLPFIYEREGEFIYSVAKDWSPDGVARRGLCPAGQGAFSAPLRGSSILPLLN